MESIYTYINRSKYYIMLLTTILSSRVPITSELNSVIRDVPTIIWHIGMNLQYILIVIIIITIIIW